MRLSAQRRLGAPIWPFLLALACKRPQAAILEFGARDGTDTERILSVFPKARYFMFEPDPRNLDILRSRPWISTVTLVPKAVWHTDGYATLHLSAGTSPDKPGAVHMGSSSLRKPKEHLHRFPWCGFNETVQVETVRLDTYAKSHQLDHIDFVWSDIQGAELDMIRGGQRTLSQTDFLWMEYDHGEMYAGQGTLAECLATLPGAWREVLRDPWDEMSGNILLERECP